MLGACLLTATVLTPMALGGGSRSAEAHETPVHLAPTPPMGWSNWDAFSPQTVTEQDIREVTDRMVENGMQDAGYEYVIVGAGWQAETRAENGEMQADPIKFPSSMKALADYVHSKGFKFGFQQAPGMRNCVAWPRPGTGTAPGDSYAEKARFDANTFASWGIDFIRLDGCCYQSMRPADMTQLEWARHVYGAWSEALDATGRDVVYWGHGGQYSTPWEWASLGLDLWRIKGDLRPCWESVLNGVDRNAPLADLAGPGHWNDPDFLVVGTPRDEWPNLPCFTGGLTDTEGRAQFSMWAIMAAPLVASTDLRRDSAVTLETLTNREVIAIDQDSLGAQGRRVRDYGEQEVWVKPLANGDRAVALFNRAETQATITTTAQEIGMTRGAAGYVKRDLWAHREAVTAGEISAVVPRHGVALFRVRPGTPEDAPPATTLSVQAP